MAEERKNSAAEVVENGASAAHAIKGTIKAGKAISGAVKGAAAGGPYGAVAGAVWGLMYRLFPERFAAIIISHALWDAAVFVWFPI